MLTNWLTIGAAGLAVFMSTACGLYEPEGDTRVQVRIPKRAATLRAAAEAGGREWYRIAVQGPGMAAQAVTGEVGARIELQVPSGSARVFSAELFDDGRLTKKTYAGRSAPVELQAGQAAVVIIEVSRVKRNSAPSLLAATITEGKYFTDSVITVEPKGFTDEDGDKPQYKYEWLVNGTAVAGQITASLDGAYFAKGDKVACRVTPHDGQADGAPVNSNEVTILNAPPVVSAVVFSDAPYTIADDIAASVTAADPDGDSFTLAYSWYLNGVQHEQASDPAFPNGTAVRGNAVYVRVTPSDAGGPGVTVQSATVTIANSLPVISGTGISPSNPHELNFITASYDAITDPDFDETMATYQWYVDGLPVPGATQPMLGGGFFEHFDEVYALITPHDGIDYGLPVSTGSVFVANTPPAITGVTTTPSGVIYEADVLTAQGYGYSDEDDDPEAYEYTWFVNGVSVAVGSASLSGANFDKEELVYVEARPFDGFEYGPAVTSAVSTVANSAPEIADIYFDTIPLTRAEAAGATAVPFDADGDAVTVSYVWWVNGWEVTGETSPSLDPSYFSRGDSIQVIATPHDGDAVGVTGSEMTTVLNAPPEAPSIGLGPIAEGPGMLNIAYYTSPFDADGDLVDVTFDWYRNGVLVAAGSQDWHSDTFVGGDVWYVVATPNDGFADGATAVAGPVIIPQAVSQVSLGGGVGFNSSMGCAVTISKDLLCWGTGYLGDGNHYTTPSIPIKIPAFASNVSSVSVGPSHACVVEDSGVLKCWGSNAFGKLGDNTLTARSTPVSPVMTQMPSSVTQVAVGKDNTCALVADGSLFCWGSNVSGQLGLEFDSSNKFVPTPVENLGGPAISVAVGGEHICAVLSSGVTKCWGNNLWEQLGNMADGNSNVPVAVVNGTGAVKVVAGEQHSCILTTTPDVKCWGRNTYGQLGDASNTTRDYAVPVGVSPSVYDVDAGLTHTCAVEGGGVKCWGRSQNGALGDNYTNDSNTPVAVNMPSLTGLVSEISLGGDGACFVTSDGAMQCWGMNKDGLLGNGGSLKFAAPVQLSLQTSASFDVGYRYACAEMFGDVWCWGDGTAGQAGTGTVPTDPFWEPVMGASGRSASAATVATGYDHTCVIAIDKTVWCMGNNFGGNLGDGTTAQRYEAVQVQGIPEGALELGLGQWFSCALTPAGTVKCWGANGAGQLGNGTFDAQSTAATTVSGLSNITDLSVGSVHACAIDTAGALYCWGDNGSGQLGDGTNLVSNVPVLVWAAGAESVTVGLNFTCAIDALGDAYCWGHNDRGKLGIDSFIPSVNTPQKVAYAEPVVEIAAGDQHACLINTEGQVYCWGDNTYYQLGLKGGDTRAPSFAVEIESQPASKLALGFNSSCAEDGWGFIICWGSNDVGQVGDTYHRMPRPVPGISEGAMPP